MLDEITDYWARTVQSHTERLSFQMPPSLLQPANLADLPTLYEQFLAQCSDNKEGQFYTPAPLVTRMIDDAFSRLAATPEIRDSFTVLDPACGAGVFLLHAWQHIATRPGAPSSQVPLRELFSQTIFGIDRDPIAVAITRIQFALLLSQDNQPIPWDALRRNIREGDFLLDPVHAKYPSSFDCILGNPPYGISRDGQINAEENHALRKRYACIQSGKINKYIAFLARSFELLSRGGISSFVVPNAWLGIRDGRGLRSLLLREKAIAAITRYTAEPFAELGVETVCVTLQRDLPHSDIAIITRDTPSGTSQTTKLPVSVCTSYHDHRIPIIWNAEIQKVMSHLRTHAYPLGAPDSPFIPMIALQAYRTGGGTPPQTPEQVRQHLFHSREKGDDLCYRYLEGRDVSRYQITWSGSFLRYGPWLAEMQPIARYHGPRVLLREITARTPYLIQAAFTDQPFLYNRSILHIRPREDAEDLHTLMQALTALLNSRLGSFLILTQGRKSQRTLFPKLVLDDLKEFLVPNGFVGSHLNLSRLSHMASQSDSMRTDPHLQEQIDRHILDLFDLSSDLISIIQSATNGNC